MIGILKKFEPIKDGITVTIHCNKDVDKHALVDMLNDVVNIELSNKQNYDTSDPLLSLISKQIKEREQAAFERGVIAAKQTEKGEDHE